MDGDGLLLSSLRGQGLGQQLVVDQLQEGTHMSGSTNPGDPYGNWRAPKVTGFGQKLNCMIM
jgi:hypothetical protein